jgi:perosamine synthetase
MIPHSRPTITPRDIKAVSRILETGQLAQGQKVSDFEAKMSRYVGVKTGVATNSGTSALHLALLALDIGKNDEVIVPSYVCSALLNAISYAGAKAKIVDVKEEDFNISPPEVRKQLSQKVKAIIVPHMFGYPADLKELLKLGVPIIEDCAQSIGAKYMERMTGTFGVISILSFYATKVMTTGEGGMVLSNHVKLLDRIRDLREYDNALNLKTRYNYKMTDFQAALGLSQLEQLPQLIQRRKQIARIYDHTFANISEIPRQENNRDSIYFRYVIKVKKAKLLIKQLNKQGIGASAPVFKPLHHYVKGFKCPIAEKLMDQCVSIPIYPKLTDIEVRQICQKTSQFVRPAHSKGTSHRIYSKSKMKVIY